MNYFATEVEKSERFYKKQAQNSSKNFNTISGGLEFCSPNSVLDRLSYAHNTIEFILSGNVDFTLQNKTYKIQPGMIFIHMKGMPHTIKNTGLKTSKYFLSIKGKEGDQILKEIIKKLGYAFAYNDVSGLQQSLQEIVAYGQELDHESHEICNQITKTILFKIIKSGIHLKELKTSSLKEYQEYKNKIRQSFLQFHNINEFSIANKTSNVKLCKLFKKYDNQTPYQYLMQLKMNYGLKLLTSQDYKVKEVGFKLGFNDPFNFTRSFKKYFGLSPKAYLDNMYKN